MPFKSWLFSLFQACRRPIRKAGRRRTPWNRVNLRLETLEDRLAPASLVTLVSFGPPGTDRPMSPYSGLVADSSGNLFGTTTRGGAVGYGTVFEVAHNTKTITILASFTVDQRGNPESLVVDSSGNLFGTRFQGGAGDFGLVYELAHNSHTITTLASFTGINGDGPTGLVMDSMGNLFGTTIRGGANGYGTVFEVAHNSNTITTLGSFTGSAPQFPNGGLVVDSMGNLFGTTIYGDTGYGTVFELAHNSNTITTLASFASTAYPEGGLVEDSSGNLFGTTSMGDMGYGTVFELAHNSNTITTLASFTGSNGDRPFWNMVEDSGGNLIGVTLDQGPGGYGTVFELKHNTHTITNLASFTGINGEYPMAGLVADRSGNLFGITNGGGAGGGGTLFEVPRADSIATKIALRAPTITYGSNAIVTVTVRSSGGTPSGSVSLSVNGGTPIVQTLSSGSITFRLPRVNAGIYSLSASYTAEGNFEASSATGTLLVNKAITVIALSAPTITYGSNAIVTVRSSGGTPTGSVSLSVNGGTPIVQMLSGGSATFILPHLNAGAYLLSVRYNAQGNFGASSATGTLLVSTASTTRPGRERFQLLLGRFDSAVAKSVWTVRELWILWTES